MILAIIYIGTFAAMEAFAYVMHRWVMHGPGWYLHASHHRMRTGMFEWNDLYAVVFALPSIVLLYGGARAGWGAWATAMGTGIATYGAIYFGFHDVIVHQRLPYRIVPRSRYLRRIVQAHRLHHAVESKVGAVSFGFLYAPSVSRLKERLRLSSEAQLRDPAPASE